MKNLLLLIQIICFFFFTGCIKHPEIKLHDKDKPKFDGVTCNGNCFIFSGRIIDTPTRNALADTELKFYYSTSHSWFSVFLGVARTDGNGVYNFRFDAKDHLDKEGYFYIRYSKEGFMYNDPISNEIPTYFHLDSSNLNTAFIQNFTFVKTTVLMVHIVAEKAINYKYLDFLYSYGMGNYGFSFYGPGPLNTTFKVITAADIPTVLHWYTLGNGVSIDQRATILVPSGKEMIYYIKL